MKYPYDPKPARLAIEQRAYTIWERNGKPEGSALADWLRAKQDLGLSAYGDL